MRDELAQRQAVIAEALTWQRTPYHENAGLKGVGVDCAHFPAAVYAAAGILEPIALGRYAKQWHLHRSAEQYVERILGLGCAELPPDAIPAPADFVVWRFGRTFSHGAIVIAWPRIIHSYVGTGVTQEDAEAAHWLKFIGEGDGSIRPRRAFTLWPGEVA